MQSVENHLPIHLSYSVFSSPGDRQGPRGTGAICLDHNYYHTQVIAGCTALFHAPGPACSTVLTGVCFKASTYPAVLFT